MTRWRYGLASALAARGIGEGDTVAVRARGSAPVIIPFLPRFDLDIQATAFDEDEVLR